MTDESPEGDDNLDEENAEYESILTTVNTTAVSFSDLVAVQKAMTKFKEDGVEIGPGDGMLVAATLFQDEPQKVRAVLFRLQALARVTKERNASGWTAGETITHTSFFRAAAICPMKLINGQIRFDTPALLEKALQLAEPEGVA